MGRILVFLALEALGNVCVCVCVCSWRERDDLEREVCRISIPIYVGMTSDWICHLLLFFFLKVRVGKDTGCFPP